MNTEHPKQSSGLKFVYVVTAIIAVSLLGFLALLFCLDVRDLFTPSTKIATESPLVILARIDTNAVPRCLVISEIWRQPKEVSLPSIRVGAKLPFTWPTNGGALPDGMVICYRRSFPVIETGHFRFQEDFVIWQGRIDNMTIKEFKIACGL
jgi:hypothetical protein